MQDVCFIMSRVMITGIGPTPVNKKAIKIYAPGLRLWNFLQVLIKNNIEVVVGEALFAEEDKVQGSRFNVQRLTSDVELPWYFLPLQPQLASVEIKKIADREKCEAIISTTEVMNSAVALSELDLPKWFDFNGDPMAERQLQAFVYGSDEGLFSQWELMLPALLSGDRFSTCSQAQKFALIGQLAVCGRLNRFTTNYDLVAVLPPGPALTEIKLQRAEKLIRGKIVADDDFVLLWTGGYNTWTDVETLFKGVTYAMERNKKIHYVSTGGAIKGHDEHTFDKFQRLVLTSPFSQRFHFVGWVELELLHSCYYEADAAINIDYFSYEGLLGCRNRLFDWIIAGLPVITTVLSEITQLLAAKNLVACFPINDSSALGELILDMTKNREKYKEQARVAREFLLSEYTNEQLLKPLVEWAKHPERAPDITQKEKGLNSLMTMQLNALRQGALLKNLEERLIQLEARLRRIEGSRLFKLLNKFKKF